MVVESDVLIAQAASALVGPQLQWRLEPEGWMYPGGEISSTLVAAPDWGHEYTIRVIFDEVLLREEHFAEDGPRDTEGWVHNDYQFWTIAGAAASASEDYLMRIS